jgi:hypothetical protein
MPKNPLSDPNQMEAMMENAKKSMVQMVPQTVIMGWINYFFTGFVLSESDAKMLKGGDYVCAHFLTLSQPLYQFVFPFPLPFDSNLCFSVESTPQTWT